MPSRVSKKFIDITLKERMIIHPKKAIKAGRRRDRERTRLNHREEQMYQ